MLKTAALASRPALSQAYPREGFGSSPAANCLPKRRQIVGLDGVAPTTVAKFEPRFALKNSSLICKKMFPAAGSSKDFNAEHTRIKSLLGFVPDATKLATVGVSC